MTIIEIMQGNYRHLDGKPKDATLEVFRQHDAEFVEKYPNSRAHFRPAWRVLENVDENKHAPWGYEWYVVDEAGLLKMHSAQYDSSG